MRHASVISPHTSTPPDPTEDPRVRALLAADTIPACYPAPLKAEIIKLAQSAQGHASSASFKSAWQLWCRFTSAHGLIAEIPPTDPDLQAHLAAFTTWLTYGHASRNYGAPTILSYTSMVRTVLLAGSPEFLFAQVRKAVPRVKPVRPPPVEISLHHFVTILNWCKRPGASYPERRTGMMIGYLACTISRSQSATVKNIRALANNSFLRVDGVQRSPTGTHVRFAQHSSKGDIAGRRLGPDLINWNYWASSPGNPLDSASMLDSYEAALGPQPPSAPFFQGDTNGRPNGTPLTYHSALSAFRRYASAIFPELAAVGLHALRRLGATLAHMKGLPPDLIQFAGGWSSLTYQRYFRLTQDDRVAVSKHIIEGDIKPLAIAPICSHTRQLHHMAPTRFQ